MLVWTLSLCVRTYLRQVLRSQYAIVEGELLLFKENVFFWFQNLHSFNLHFFLIMNSSTLIVLKSLGISNGDLEKDRLCLSGHFHYARVCVSAKYQEMNIQLLRRNLCYPKRNILSDFKKKNAYLYFDEK